MTTYTRHPDLAPEFVWGPRTKFDTLPTALTLHGEILVSMLDDVHGQWTARLHLEDGLHAPLILRCKRPVSQCHRCDQRTHAPLSAGS